MRRAWPRCGLVLGRVLRARPASEEIEERPRPERGAEEPVRRPVRSGALAACEVPEMCVCGCV